MKTISIRLCLTQWVRSSFEAVTSCLTINSLPSLN